MNWKGCYNMGIFKKGFTLAELLLCLAIVGVVSALGMTATKQSAERAYKGYYYTGYVNLYNAVADFEDKRFFNDQDPANGRPNPTIFNRATFATRLGQFFNANANGTSITARNGIVYNITEGSFPRQSYFITMRVPQMKSRQYPNGTDTVAFIYIRDNDSGNHELLPLNRNMLPPNAWSGISQNDLGQTDLQTRRDLLPAYFDDGVVGQPVLNNGAYSKKQYRSFRDTYCIIHSGINVIYPVSNTVVLRCPAGLPNIPTAVNTVLRVEKPSKAK